MKHSNFLKTLGAATVGVAVFPAAMIAVRCPPTWEDLYAQKLYEYKLENEWAAIWGKRMEESAMQDLRS